MVSEEETFTNIIYETLNRTEILEDNKRSVDLKMSISFSKIISILLCCLAIVIISLQTLTFVYILKIQSDNKLDSRDLSGTEYASEKNFSIIVTGYKQQVKELQNKNWILKNTTGDLQNEYKELQSKNWELKNTTEDLQNEYKELQSKHSELKNRTEDLQNEYKELQNESRELLSNVSLLQINNDIIQQQVEELQNENRKLQNKNAELQNENRDLQSKNTEFLSSHAKCAYNALRSQKFTTVLDLRLPFNHSLTANGIGKRIFIGGVVHTADWRHFEINFVRRNGDIGFHVNFRRKMHGTIKKIVANSRINGTWFDESYNTRPWPVVRHKSFCTEIINKKNSIEVKFDGQRLFDYSYRSRIGSISDFIYLQIVGDFTLEEVSFTVP